MRRLFHQLHLWLSIPAGVILTVVCLSGAALVFEQDITQALNPHLYRSQPPEEGTPFLPPSELMAHLQRQVPDTLTLSSLQMPGTPDDVCMASFKQTGKRSLSINPYTGHVNGWTRSYPFFQTMRKLHRWLMDAPAKKGEMSVGKAVVGVATLLMVFILISGLVIWIPRTAKALKNRLQMSFTKGWRRFWYDSHVALGFYATFLLLLMALTGLTWSFGWYRTAAYSLFGGIESRTTHSQSPETHRTKGYDRPSSLKEQPARQPDYTVWNKALSTIQTMYPDYQSVTFSTGKAQVATPSLLKVRQTDIVNFDPQTGRVTDIEHYDERPRSQTLRGWFYALHTGSWGGWATKIPYFLAALIGGILPITGYYLWLTKKLKRYRNQKSLQTRHFH